MILLSELSRRRIRSIQKLIRVGRNEVVVVLRVDKEKGAQIPCVVIRSLQSCLPGYIDLSKRRVSPEDIAKCDERYTKSKTVASIMRHVATRTGGSYPHKPTVGADQPPHEEEVDTGAADSSEDMRLEHLYEQIAWPLAEKYGHTYDAFKLALTYVLIVSILGTVANIET